MSKLAQKLKDITESAAPAMGFRAASVSTRARGPLLLAILAHPDAKSAKAAIEAGADALVVRSSEAADAKAVAQAAADVPCGVLSKSEAIDASALKEAGLDFVAFVPACAPASVLRAEGLGKIAVVPAAAEMESLRGMDRAGVDGVLLEQDGAGDFVSAQFLMTCYFLSGAMNKPLMAVIPTSAGIEDIGALWDAGVDGLFVEAGPARLKELRKVVSSLPARSKRKGGKDVPRLPWLGNGRAAHEEEEQEDE
ncbi:MAG: hypothetical protein Q7T05_06075 [Dehalococcoidia bacterium]|nr:hypothetical protein [Dehalococcoidia bacterium]